MTNFIISFFTLSLAIFMATDTHCKKNEKNSIFFLLFVGAMFLIFGLFTFELNQISKISIKDWVLIGFFPIVLLYLKTKSKLVEIQSEITGKKTSLLELNLELIENSSLIKKFKIISKIQWSYAILVLVVVFWSELKNAI